METTIGFRVWGLGFRIFCLGFRVGDLKPRGSGFRVNAKTRPLNPRRKPEP